MSVRGDSPLFLSHFKRDESGTPGSNHMISIIPENKLECTFVVQIERKDDTKQCLVRTTEVLQRT